MEHHWPVLGLKRPHTGGYEGVTTTAACSTPAPATNACFAAGSPPGLSYKKRLLQQWQQEQQDKQQQQQQEQQVVLVSLPATPDGSNPGSAQTAVAAVDGRSPSPESCCNLQTVSRLHAAIEQPAPADIHSPAAVQPTAVQPAAAVAVAAPVSHWSVKKQLLQRYLQERETAATALVTPDHQQVMLPGQPPREAARVLDARHLLKAAYAACDDGSADCSSGVTDDDSDSMYQEGSNSLYLKCDLTDTCSSCCSTTGSAW